MSEIDWSKAPEGATHWERESYGASAGWMKKDGGEWFFLSSEGCWLKHIISNVSAERLQNMVPCPDSSPAWNGEGLPPTGTVCECQNQAMKWLKGTIVYVGKDNGTQLAIMQTDTEILYGEDGEFRPIRTPEQIAAAEREKFAEGLAREMGKEGSPNSLKQARRMYDLGYRKQEQPK